MSTSLQMRRTGWDIVLGALLVVGGLMILGDAALATEVSILFIGWVLLISGVLGLVASLFRIGRGGFWSTALSGGALTVLGLFFLRNTEAAAVTLTLLAGTIFLTSGVVRLGAAAHDRTYRLPLLLGGVVSTAMGLLVLFNLFDASYVLLGVLLGIQVIVDGLMMMIVGRWHSTTEAPARGEVEAR